MCLVGAAAVWCTAERVADLTELSGLPSDSTWVDQTSVLPIIQIRNTTPHSAQMAPNASSETPTWVSTFTD